MTRISSALGHRRVLAALIAVFFLAVTLNLHGFSFSKWHDVIDGSKKSAVLAGSPRVVRSDDWLVYLPAVFAQIADKPAFRSQNPLIGVGEGQVVPAITAPIPAKNLLTVFRPQLWGYFLGADIGMSWQWWFYLLGLVYVFFALGLALSGGRVEASLLTAIALAYAPFFQFWSLNSAPMVIFALGGLLAAIRLLSARQFSRIVFWAVVLAWTSGGLVFAVYPPYQVAMGYVVLALFAAIVWGKREQVVKSHALPAWGAAIGAVGLAILAAYLVYREIREPLNALLGTAYPGNRMSTGGSLSAVKLFNSNLLSFAHGAGVNAFVNICEGAAFFFVFPPLLLFFGGRFFRRDFRPCGAWIALVGIVVVGLAWSFVSLPEWLARWTLLGMAPPERTLIALGIANAFLLLLFVAGGLVATRAEAAAISGVWGGFLATLGFQLRALVPGFPISFLVFAVIVSSGLIFLLLRKPRAGLYAFTLFSVAATIGFNPISVGGSEFIRKNQLSQAISHFNQERPGKWVAYGERNIPNLFRMIGVPALNGVHFYPQFEFWSKLDPAGVWRNAYNRYAHVIFELPGEQAEIEVHSPFPDVVVVKLHPDHPNFLDLDVDYILVTGEPVKFTNFHWVQTVGSRHIYRRNQPIGF